MSGGGVSQAVIGFERERGNIYITSHHPKTVPSQHDHSLNEKHPKMGEPASNGREKLSLKCVAENEGEKGKKMMIE